MDSYLFQWQWCEVKGKQPCPGFELGCQFHFLRWYLLGQVHLYCNCQNDICPTLIMVLIFSDFHFIMKYSVLWEIKFDICSKHFCFSSKVILECDGKIEILCWKINISFFHSPPPYIYIYIYIWMAWAAKCLRKFTET